MNTNTISETKLTQFSHGAGCGCKISPKILDIILKSNESQKEDPFLLVGNHDRDDAAVYDMGNGEAIVSTTDFFMPVVDDAFDFGRIASANAISDVYAMGGTPFLAIAILGWPIDKISPEVANQVLAGARHVCSEAGIVLAGGHSIDSPEPIFGLAVTGKVKTKNLKTNGGAKAGDVLFLTKPLGVGILTTAQKRGLLKPDHSHIARDQMVMLNSIGIPLSEYESVHALTDVTGFGLLGHLSEMCEASGLSATIIQSEIPVIACVDEYLALNSVPGGTGRNWDSYGHKIGELDAMTRSVFCDPQTSGGLLIAVAPESAEEIAGLLRKNGLPDKIIGQFEARNGQYPLIVRKNQAEIK